MKTEHGTVGKSLETAEEKIVPGETAAWFFLAKAAVQALCAIADAIISLNEDEEI